MSASPPAQAQLSRPVSETALKLAAQVWLTIAVLGQWVFLVYIAAFYGPATLGGNFQGWLRNKYLTKSYIPGDTAGNLAFAAHVLLAGCIALGGALQLMPRLRSRLPALHRWNGRVFFVTAIGTSVAGLYLVWGRHDYPNLLAALALSLNAALIIGFATLAWRAALSRNIAAHRAWAMRSYLVSNAQWFTRILVFGWLVLAHGPVGMTDNSDGPVDIIVGFGCYLIPLFMLELYVRARAGGGARGRAAMATGLVLATAFMSIGIVALFVLVQRPLLARL